MNFKRLAFSTCPIILISVLFVFQAFAAVYYVKNGGNDKASGLSDTKAWRTIAKVNDFAENPGFSHGDVIQFKRGDTWSNDETLGHDGSIINWQGVNGITFQDYGSGAKPRFDANTQQPIWIETSSISNVTIKNLDCSGMDAMSLKSHIDLDGFSGLLIDGVEANGHTGASTYPRFGTFINVYNIDGDIEIKNCVLQNAMKETWAATAASSWAGKDVNLIRVKYLKGDDDDIPKTEGVVRIHDNILHDVWADCIIYNGIRSETYIYSNTMYNFGENAIDLKAIKNCDIYGNQLSRGSYGFGGSGGGKSNIATHSVGDSVPLYPEDIIIRSNEFYDSEYYGIRLLSTTLNTQIYGNTFRSVSTPISISTSPGTKVHDNVILGYTDYDAKGYFRTAIIVTGTNQNGVEIYSNSIYLNSQNYNYGIYVIPRAGRTGMEITNNIIHMTQSSTSVYPLYVAIKAGDYPKVTDNCFYNSSSNNSSSSQKNRIGWKETIYDTTNLTAWRKVNNSKGIFGDPLFKDPENGNLQLKDSSPCSQWGADLSRYSKTKSRISSPKNFVINPKG